MLFTAWFVGALAALALFILLMVTLTNLGDDARKAAEGGKVALQTWRTRTTWRAGGGSVALFLWVSFLVASAGSYIDTRVQERNKALQARYDACLERTTPEVCELHWMEHPARVSDAETASGPALVLTPNGAVSLGIGL